MSDANKTGDVTPVDPTPADVAREEPRVDAHPAPLVEPQGPETFDRGPVVDHVEVYDREPVVAHADPVPAPVEAVEAHPVAQAAPVAAPVAAPNIVYVTTPVPPRARGNRGLGTVLAVLGAILFAVLYAAAYAGATALTGSPVAPIFTAFISSALFWVPVLVFLVAFVLLVLLLNRAGWWAHVLGSLIVALVVYFASAGILMLVSGLPLFAGESSNLPFTYFLALPGIVLAGIVAREVSIWVGLGIAARGRRLTVKNRESRAEFEREQAERRAEHERSTTPA